MFSPGTMPAVAVDDGDAEQRPARSRLLDVARDLGFRHAGIMFERHRRDRLAVSSPRQMPVKVDDRADIGAAARQRADLGGRCRSLALQRTVRSWWNLARRPPATLPPVIGGKKAISRAPAIGASGFT